MIAYRLPSQFDAFGWFMLDSFPSRPMEAARLALARLVPGPELSLVDVLREICRTAANILVVNRVGIWFLVDDRTALRCAVLYERDKQEFSEGTTLSVSDFPAYFTALENRRSIPAKRATTNESTHELSEAYLYPLNISSMLDAPIFENGEVIGVACHEHSGMPREWTLEERDFAASLADTISLKLKSAALIEARSALRKHNEIYLALNKAEALGRLAAGAAHDFRNLLTIILGCAAEIRGTKQLPDATREMAKHIIEAGERGSALAQEMMNYGEREAESPRVVNLIELTDGVIPLLRTAIGPRHQIQFQHGSHVGKTFIDPSQFERILMNLVVNARDAMPNGGEISLSIAMVDCREDGRSGKYTMLGVTDTGIGMELQNQSRIFDPYFTTKPRGQGTGLGLAVVKRIVDRAGGWIDVTSAVDHGTTIRVYFPRIACDA